MLLKYLNPKTQNNHWEISEESEQLAIRLINNNEKYTSGRGTRTPVCSKQICCLLPSYKFKLRDTRGDLCWALFSVHIMYFDRALEIPVSRVLFIRRSTLRHRLGTSHGGIEMTLIRTANAWNRNLIWSCSEMHLRSDMMLGLGLGLGLVLGLWLGLGLGLWLGLVFLK